MRLGSTRVSRVGFGVAETILPDAPDRSPIQRLTKSPRKRDAFANTRDARATRNPYAPASAEGRDSSRPGRAEARPSKSSHPTVTPLPFCEVFHRRRQILSCEIRPELWGYIHLGIGKLPEQEI